MITSANYISVVFVLVIAFLYILEIAAFILEVAFNIFSF